MWYLFIVVGVSYEDLNKLTTISITTEVKDKGRDWWVGMGLPKKGKQNIWLWMDRNGGTGTEG